MSEVQRVEPMADYIAVRKAEHRKTAGGIIIPDTAESAETYLEVVAVPSEGAGAKFAVGDLLFVGNGTRCLPCTVQGEQVFLMRADVVVARVHFGAVHVGGLQ